MFEAIQEAASSTGEVTYALILSAVWYAATKIIIHYVRRNRANKED